MVADPLAEEPAREHTGQGEEHQTRDDAAHVVIVGQASAVRHRPVRAGTEDWEATATGSTTRQSRRSVGRTFSTVERLCASAGLDPRTVGRHVDGL
jgi:hypothetical protein